jgi:hypothetical protein
MTKNWKKISAEKKPSAPKENIRHFIFAFLDADPDSEYGSETLPLIHGPNNCKDIKP